jgi:hypothetical protein
MLQQIFHCVEDYTARQDHPIAVDLQRLVCLFYAKGEMEGCSALLFDDDPSAPRLVAKSNPIDRAHRREGRTALEIELENLRTLDAIGMNRDRETTPSPLGIWNTDGCLVTLQSALRGPLMKNIPGRRLFSPDRIARTTENVFAWWTGLQQAFGTRTQTLTDELYREQILEPVARFGQRFVLDTQEQQFLARRFEQEQRLLGAELPFMARHGDFCTANMVETTDGLGVFDWEFPLRHELPLFDVFHFFASLRYPFRGFGGESSHYDSFLAVFWGNNYVNAALRRCLADLCGRFAIDPEWLGDLFVLSLVQIANLKYDALIEFQIIDEPPETDAPGTAEAIRASWRSLESADKDVPFACIRDGAFMNTRYIVRHGFPAFAPD